MIFFIIEPFFMGDGSKSEWKMTQDLENVTQLTNINLKMFVNKRLRKNGDVFLLVFARRSVGKNNLENSC